MAELYVTNEEHTVRYLSIHYLDLYAPVATTCEVDDSSDVLCQRDLLHEQASLSFRMQDIPNHDVASYVITCGEPALRSRV